ncbi:hypothetical protein RN001_012200 [Aquatica leii]|uniref:Uncharacterized protein n=1 Tax=Aquatica leii TaxID=1421715 RepID=A0AAN7QEM8_9COLE|nr:hypothetical protein RN001_012200 [Aquatica leii]
MDINVTENMKLNSSAESYNMLYERLWNKTNPSTRNFFVDPDTLEVRGRNIDHITVIPIIATIMLICTVFLLILFRHNPTMVAGTVAGCLTVIGIYIILTACHDNKLAYV